MVAFYQAKATGRPVLVADRATKTTNVIANPDGSLTTTIASGPVQERDSSSALGFAPIDTTLKRGVGGFQPVRADTSVMFSAGGDSVLATAGFGGTVERSIGSTRVEQALADAFGRRHRRNERPTSRRTPVARSKASRAGNGWSPRPAGGMGLICRPSELLADRGSGRSQTGSNAVSASADSSAPSSASDPTVTRIASGAPKASSDRTSTPLRASLAAAAAPSPTSA
jgi:hypothetical protein